MKLLCLIAGACLAMTGCVSEVTGPDAVCQWPGGDGDARHLSQDAGRAEDLAIRYADGHARPNNAGTNPIPAYVKMRADCMTALFQAVAAEHRVTVGQVRESVGRDHSRSMDAAVMLSFGWLYAWFANGLAKRVWRRFPPARDRAIGICASAAIGPVLAVLGAALGQGWSFWLETLRVGYGHLVYRVDRIPWGHHVPAILLAGVGIFWVCAWLRFQDVEPEPPLTALRVPAASSFPSGSRWD